MGVEMSTQVANAIAAIPAFALAEGDLAAALESSCYPGAKRESIALVVNYCRAMLLDPMQKPVHIVPMRVKKAGTRDEYEWRDVVMPGIGLYRVQAARTGQHAGTSEPEFGPTKVLKVGDFEIDYPEWCRVVVKRRLQSGEVVEFAAVEYWLENYATEGKGSAMPNAMWKRRKRGQIAKCAEAQALRKAFPELGSQPTADEMEGRETFDVDGVTVVDAPKAKPVQMPASKRAADVSDAAPLGPPLSNVHEQNPGTATKETIDAETGEVTRTAAPAKAEAPAANDPPVGDGERAYLRTKATAAKVDLDALAKEAGVNLEALTKSGFGVLKAAIAKGAGHA